MSFQLLVKLLPGHMWPCLGIFLIVRPWVGGVGVGGEEDSDVI